MSELWVWRIAAVALFTAWVWTFSFWALKAEVSQSSWLIMFRDQLISTVQQLAQQQQGLEQRLKALEQQKRGD